MNMGIDPSFKVWWLIPVFLILSLALMCSMGFIVLRIQIKKQGSKIIGAILSGLVIGLSAVSLCAAVAILGNGGYLRTTLSGLPRAVPVFFLIGAIAGVYVFVSFPHHRTYYINGVKYTIGPVDEDEKK